MAISAQHTANKMNYTEIKEIAAIYESIPSFEQFAYWNEPIVSIDRNDDEVIECLHFPVGSLRRKLSLSPDGSILIVWLLDNSCDITGVFIAAQ